MRTVAERLAMIDGIFSDAAGRGLMLETPDDGDLDGRTLRLRGHEVVNFGSCSYLGLEMDPRLRQGVCEAVMRYGTQFSSSRSYISAPSYTELEGLLEELFGGSIVVAASTSLGHLSALPVLVAEGDVVLLDQQVHHSVHIAVNQLRAQGTTVEVVRHNRMDLLEERIEALRGRHPKVWYMADGVYSMFADLAPVHELGALLERHEQLHVYVDDSHGMSWAGPNGRGYVLGEMPIRDRMFVAASLNKAFAAAGGAFVFPDAALARKMRVTGGPMMFGGPIQPPMLGAAIASARIHLSPEIVELQAALQERVTLCNDLLEQRGMPLVGTSHAPIRYVGAGLPRVGNAVAERMLADGLYVNTAPFPAVPMKQGGIRTPLTLHHTRADIERLVDSLAHHLPAVLEEQGSSLEEVRATFGLAEPAAPAAPAPAPAAPIAVHTRPGLTLEHHRSIGELDTAEWDALLGDRGSFTAAGIAFLERAFSGNERPEDNWDFHFYVVRDETGAAVLATFFTAALWKDDMLSTAAVSRRVEELREDDPYFLTSRTFAMGSLLTEGSHMHLDRSGDWRGALDMLLAAVAEEQERADAGALVLRDFDGHDAEIEAYMLDAGLVKFPMLDSLVLDLDFETDEELLERLSYKARTHQRREVLAWEPSYSVEVLRPGGRVPSDAELEHLHGLYRAVEERGLELNTFRLPVSLFRAMLDEPSWELVLLRLAPEAGGPADGSPVAFGAHFVGREHYAPLVIGLDYDYVLSHRAYRQALLQAIRRGRSLGARRILLGMGAPLEKRRFGARAQNRAAYVQAVDHYGMEVLASIEADVGARPVAA